MSLRSPMFEIVCQSLEDFLSVSKRLVYITFQGIW